MKKHKPTADEIANDYSLRWHPYAKWEAVYSDAHRETMRFVGYENGMVRISTLSMAILPDLVSPLSIRRPSISSKWAAVRIRTESGHAWFATNRMDRIACQDQNEAEMEALKRNQ